MYNTFPPLEIINNPVQAPLKYQLSVCRIKVFFFPWEMLLRLHREDGD